LKYKHLRNSQVVLYNPVQSRPGHPDPGWKPFQVDSQVVPYNQRELSLLVPDELLLPVPPAVVFIAATVQGLITRIVFAPLFAAVSTYLPIVRIREDFLAMIMCSPAALAFGRQTHFLFGVEWGRIERLTAVGADGFPGFHLELRAWIGPAILCQGNANQ